MCCKYILKNNIFIEKIFLMINISTHLTNLNNVISVCYFIIFIDAIQKTLNNLLNLNDTNIILIIQSAILY